MKQAMSMIAIIKEAARDAEQLMIAGEIQIARQAMHVRRLLRAGQKSSGAEKVLKAMIALQDLRRRDLDYWRTRAALASCAPDRIAKSPALSVRSTMAEAHAGFIREGLRD